jgi:hypothetical protein
VTATEYVEKSLLYSLDSSDLSDSHSGQAGDSAEGRISLRLKLARPGIYPLFVSPLAKGEILWGFWIPCLRGNDGLERPDFVNELWFQYT